MRGFLCLLLLFACDDSTPMSQDLSANVCRFSTGRVCGYDSLGGCAAEDPCNWCDCSTPGGGASCTMVACLDAGTSVRRCSMTNDCPEGQVCAFDPGCDSSQMGRCSFARECTSGTGAVYCGCDGNAFSAPGLCADRPHSGRGGC